MILVILRLQIIIAIVAGLLVGVPGTASALTFDFLTQSLTIGPDSISITTDGVTATVQAYHVEFAAGTSTIYGPFTTGTISSHQVFGTNTSGVGNPGLGLTTVQDLGQQDTDVPSGGLQPGFDNFPSLAIVLDPLPSIQFALFSFNFPVDISQVTVDDVSNFDRDIWVAGGSSAPNLSLDLVNAFSGFTVINSGDDISDGIFVHTFGPLSNISFLAVGTGLPGTVGDLGPFTQGLPTGGSQFYINALSFEVSQNGDNGGVSPVPEPGSVALLGLGLAVLLLARRHQNR